MKRAVITVARLTFGVVAMALACLHSATAHDPDSIKEKRLRAEYCLGYFVAVQQIGTDQICALSPDTAGCAESARQGKLNNKLKVQRLALYLTATQKSGDYSERIATAQGKLDAEQCFANEADPQVLSCEAACMRRMMPRPSSVEDALQHCGDECTSTVCKKTFDCLNYDPW
jgi:hypothetical protein